MTDRRLTLLLGSTVDIYYHIDTYPEEGDFTFGKEGAVLAGGPPLNTGCVAAAAGASVSALDCLNPEEAATSVILETLRKYGVDLSHVVYSSEARSGKAVVLSREGQRTFIVIDPVHPPYEVTPELQELLNGSAYLYTMTQLPDLCFRDRGPLREARRNGAKIVFDGSGMYDTPETVSAVLELADGLFINRTCYDRLAQALGGEPKEILTERGSEFVCVTDGENGALCRTREGEYFTPALPIGEVLDGTGAGDAFAGTFLAGRLMGLDHERCLKRAAAAGAYACTVMGGQGGCCSFEELNAFAARYGWEV